MSVAAKMVEHFNEGAEIVFAVRRDRASDSWFKRSSADRLINWLGAEVIPHHADFRLMSRALRALALAMARMSFCADLPSSSASRPRP
jgi:hypothetical protein